jgi:hypothetical protein
VLPIVERLHNRMFRVWYDEGIEAGANWPEVIARHMIDAALIVLFISHGSAGSQNCTREMNFAIDSKKPMVCVYLDNTELPPGLKMQLSVVPSVWIGENIDETASKLIETGAFTPELIGDGVEGYGGVGGGRKRRVNLSLLIGIVCVLLVAIAGVITLGFSKGWFDSKMGIITSTVSIQDENGLGEPQDFTITAWSSTVMRDIIFSQTGDAQALYCCGNNCVSGRSAIEYRNGEYLVGGKAVERGNISDLDSIGEMTSLMELSLCYESFTDLSELSALDKLSYLDLSGSPVSNFSAITNLKNLATLKLSHTDITDLTPALKMPALKRLIISYDMVKFAEAVLSGDFEIVITE